MSSALLPSEENPDPVPCNIDPGPRRGPGLPLRVCRKQGPHSQRENRPSGPAGESWTHPVAHPQASVSACFCRPSQMSLLGGRCPCCPLSCDCAPCPPPLPPHLTPSVLHGSGPHLPGVELTPMPPPPPWDALWGQLCVLSALPPSTLCPHGQCCWGCLPEGQAHITDVRGVVSKGSSGPPALQPGPHR